MKKNESKGGYHHSHSKSFSFQVISYLVLRSFDREIELSTLKSKDFEG